MIPIIYGPGRMRMRASLRNQPVDALAISRLTVGVGNCLTVAGVHTINTLPRCIRIGTPLKQRILATPETLILPTGKCLTVARVHNIDTLPWRSRAGILLFISHWVDMAGYAGKVARRCTGGVSVGSFIGSPGINTGHTVNSETAGECVAWPLSLAMRVRRRQGESKAVNGSRRVQAPSEE